MNALHLIDADAARAHGLIRRLEASCWRVQWTRSALAALSAMEWERPNLVVVHADIDDVSATELTNVIRADDALCHARVACYGAGPLLDGLGSSEETTSFDMIIHGEQPAQIADVIGWPDTAALYADEVDAEAATLEMDALPPREPPAVANSLRLDEVLEALVEATVTGRLTINVQGTEATHAVLLDGGQIVHAVCGRTEGVEVLRDLLTASQRGDALWYQFEKMPLDDLGGSTADRRELRLEEICELAGDADEHGTQRIDRRALDTPRPN